MELQTGLTDGTIVTFAGGSLAETARVLLVAEASGQVLVVTDRTPFHPQSLTWPDQPGDRGSLALADGGLVTVRDSREAVLNVATGMLLAGDAAQGQKRGDPDLRAVRHRCRGRSCRCIGWTRGRFPSWGKWLA